MEEELHGIWDEGSLKDEEPPPNIKPIKTRFAYKLKRGADGEIVDTKHASWQGVSLNAPGWVSSRHSAQS